MRFFMVIIALSICNPVMAQTSADAARLDALVARLSSGEDAAHEAAQVVWAKAIEVRGEMVSAFEEIDAFAIKIANRVTSVESSVRRLRKEQLKQAAELKKLEARVKRLENVHNRTN